MHAYLQAHPQVLMSEPKEPHHFSTDIPLLMPYEGQVDDRQAYLDLFADAGDRPVIGEASVWYLYSQVAAKKVYEFNPDAKLLCMLRHPVEMAWSMFRFMSSLGFETTTDFRKAIELSPERQAGRSIPAGLHRACCVLYTEIGCFATQLQRYLEIWPREQIHVVFFDDLKRDSHASFSEVLGFLGIDKCSDADLSIRNKTDPAQDLWMRRLRRKAPGMVQTVRRLLPVFAWNAGRDLMRSVTANSRLDKIPEECIGILNEIYQPEIMRLASLLDTDLSDWIQRYSQS